jgi:hypothetical protein
MRNDFESNYLEHHGILGQKHGQRNGPPYPLDANKHSASEKKAGWTKSLSGAIKKHKLNKQRKKALDKARKIRKQNAEEKKRIDEFSKKKEQILRSGDPKEVLKYRKQLTDQEISSALNRIRNEASLKEMVSKSEKTGMQKIDSMMDTVGKVTNWAEKGIKFYDTTADIYNTFIAKDESEKWPKIKSGKKDKKKKKDDDDDD